MKRRCACELCGGEASVHCVADAAYLCWPCDARVHGANFLVSRHLRTVACSTCGTGARWISGPGSASSPMRSLCDSCCSDDFSSSSSGADSASSSSCLSTAESSATKPGRASSLAGCERRKQNFVASRQAAAERILAGWCSGLGLSGGRRFVEMTLHSLRAFKKGMAVMPLRVAVAAALWHAIKEREGGEKEKKKNRAWETTLLRKLEARSRVPARLIVMAESRLANASRRRALAAEEGWAECQ